MIELEFVPYGRRRQRDQALTPEAPFVVRQLWQRVSFCQIISTYSGQRISLERAAAFELHLTEGELFGLGELERELGLHLGREAGQALHTVPVPL